MIRLNDVVWTLIDVAQKGEACYGGPKLGKTSNEQGSYPLYEHAAARLVTSLKRIED